MRLRRTTVLPFLPERCSGLRRPCVSSQQSVGVTLTRTLLCIPLTPHNAACLLQFSDSLLLFVAQFLMQDIDLSQPSVDAKHRCSSAEEVWDTISVVSLQATDEIQGSAPPKIHFVVGGVLWPEGPGHQQQPKPLGVPGQAREEEANMNNGSS